MPSDSPSHGGRRHFHRGRRGHDRRGGDRRTPQPSPNQPPEQAARGDQLDVEQIMREIRSTIAQRHGVDLTDQQVQELAARRLESILDPRTMKPSLLDQLRRSAGARPDTVAAADRASLPYEFEDTTLYDSPSGFVRFMRKVLNPLLKLFFNPNPLIRALHIQARLNTEATKREAERDQRQAEWNALHYEILQRIVSETVKVSLELQQLSLKVEALSTKVDFNERRVRGVEGLVNQPRLAGGRERDRDRDAIPVPPSSSPAPEPAAVATAAAPEGLSGEVPRRRRRRRRGRRGGGAGEMVPSAVAAPTTADAFDTDEGDEGDDVNEAPEVLTTGTPDVVTTGTEAIDQTSDVAEVPAPPTSASAPERVTPQLQTSDPVVREEAAPDLPTTTQGDDEPKS